MAENRVQIVITADSAEAKAVLVDLGQRLVDLGGKGSGVVDGVNKPLDDTAKKGREAGQALEETGKKLDDVGKKGAGAGQELKRSLDSAPAASMRSELGSLGITLGDVK